MPICEMNDLFRKAHEQKKNPSRIISPKSQMNNLDTGPR